MEQHGEGGGSGNGPGEDQGDMSSSLESCRAVIENSSNA